MTIDSGDLAGIERALNRIANAAEEATEIARKQHWLDEYEFDLRHGIDRGDK